MDLAVLPGLQLELRPSTVMPLDDLVHSAAHVIVALLLESCTSALKEAAVRACRGLHPE